MTCTFHSWKDFRTVFSPCLGTNIVHCYILNVFHFIDIKKYKRLKYTDGQQSKGKWNIEFLNIDCPSLVKPRLTSLEQKEVMMLVTAVRANIVVPSHMWITDFHWLQINIKSENFVDCTLFFVSNSEAVGSFHRCTGGIFLTAFSLLVTKSRLFHAKSIKNYTTLPHFFLFSSSCLWLTTVCWCLNEGCLSS